MINDMKNW